MHQPPAAEPDPAAARPGPDAARPTGLPPMAFLALFGAIFLDALLCDTVASWFAPVRTPIWYVVRVLFLSLLMAIYLMTLPARESRFAALSRRMGRPAAALVLGLAIATVVTGVSESIRAWMRA